MPDQCGSSPRWKQLISVLSSMESTHSRPNSLPRRTSSCHCRERNLALLREALSSLPVPAAAVLWCVPDTSGHGSCKRTWRFDCTCCFRLPGRRASSLSVAVREGGLFHSAESARRSSARHWNQGPEDPERCSRHRRRRRVRPRAMTRVARITASRGLCVTNRMVVPVSRHSSLISRCIPARVPGSSALKASSISRILGRMMSACAMATRCCMPPESWCGYFARVGFAQAHAAQVAERLGPEFLAPRPPGGGESSPRNPISVTSRPNVMFSSTVRSGKQRILLRHVAAAAIGLRARTAFHQHLPAGWHFLGQHQPQQASIFRSPFARRWRRIRPHGCRD